jgi:hypothetical protein
MVFSVLTCATIRTVPGCPVRPRGDVIRTPSGEGGWGDDASGRATNAARRQDATTNNRE